jgi:hypothetical protein
MQVLMLWIHRLYLKKHLKAECGIKFVESCKIFWILKFAELKMCGKMSGKCVPFNEVAKHMKKINSFMSAVLGGIIC